MKTTKKYSPYVSEYLKRKFFKFDLKIFHCFLLVIVIFVIALIWAKTDNFLLKKFELVDSTSDWANLVQENTTK